MHIKNGDSLPQTVLLPPTSQVVQGPKRESAILHPDGGAKGRQHLLESFKQLQYNATIFRENRRRLHKTDEPKRVKHSLVRKAYFLCAEQHPHLLRRTRRQHLRKTKQW